MKIDLKSNERSCRPEITGVFDALDKILGDKPATKPPVIIDTLNESSAG